MKQKMLYFGLSFCIPILILGIYIITVNGNLESLFINDLNEQYIFLFDYWKQILNGEQSLFYSFSIGLGESFLGTYAYYLASPLNWLLFFVSEKFIMPFVSILILVKIGLCSLSMFIYLKKTNQNKDIINLMFSICYALMGFQICYYFNIMWLDVIFFTPLVILGLENLIKNGNSKLYCITLFLSIISQYYMSFMLCIFCVIYFIYKAYVLERLNGKTIKKFLLSSLTVGLLSAFFTIPVLYNLMNVYRDNTTNSIDFIQKLSNLLVSFGIHRQSVALNYNYPIFYCGLIQIVLVVNILLYEKNKKKKKAILFVLLFFVASILFDVLIQLWHGGSYPYGLLYRFSFLISFFLIIVNAEYYMDYYPFSNRWKIGITITYFIILIFGYLLNEKIDYSMITINVLFFYSNLILLNINKVQKNKIHEFALVLFVLMELVFNMKCNFALNENLRIEDQSTLDNQRFQLYESMNQIGDNTYRIAGQYIYYDNELLPMKKGSITLFLSSNNQNMFQLLNNSGYYAASSYTLYDEDNYFMNSLLGVKYWYGHQSDSMVQQPLTTISIKGYEIPVYENPYALSLGYLINENKEIHYDNNPFDYQNQIVKAITGKTIFQPLDSTILENSVYEVTTDESEFIYLYVESESKIDFYDIYTNIYINDTYVSSENVMENIVKIKNEYPNETIQIKIEYITQLDQNPNVYFYTEDREHNLNLLRALQQRELQNITIQKNKLTGKIDVKEDSLLMVTIPYEKGFTIFVDGKKTDYEKVYDVFIGISLSKGKHIIQITYNKPYGIELGIGISGITMIALCINRLFQKK